MVIAVAADDDLLAAGMLVMHPGADCAVAASSLRVKLHARRAQDDVIGAELGATQIMSDQFIACDTRNAAMVAALAQVEQQIRGELPQFADLVGQTAGDAGPAAQVATLFAIARTLADAPGRDDGPAIVACELRVCRAPRRARIRYHVVRRPRGGAS